MDDQRGAAFADRMNAAATAPDVQCGFCERYRDQVRQLIIGLLPGVAICDDCVRNAVEIIEVGSSL